VEKKFTRDIIWILWDGLLHYSKESKNTFIEKLMQGLIDIFSIRYTTASCKKRRYLLYFAVSLLTEPVPTNIELVSKKDIIENVVSKINQIYKQIKKNEESPNTEYLFANMEKQNTFEKSMKQMEIVNSINFTRSP
jgi:hypothetical protein